MRIAYYVTADPPPDPFVTSVRAVVLDGDSVLTLRNRDSTHALPGGRREPGESFEQTVRREVSEETGCELQSLRPLGVVHLHHLGPRPAHGYRSYPDFLWAIYLAGSAGCDAARRVEDGYELEARFVPVEQALERIDFGSRIYVRAAVNSP